MQPLERGQLWVMLVRGLLVALALLLAASIPAFATQDDTGVEPGLIIGALALLLAYPTLVAPFRSFRSWGFRLDSEELILRHGVWTHVETSVPLRRVQHLDVAQGPLERGFGVSRLMLHTAGTANSLVVLPGLSRATAEGIRDEIRAQIRQEPE